MNGEDDTETLTKGLAHIVQMLAMDMPPPESNRDHGLSCDWSSHRKRHIKPDLLLIYEKREGLLWLIRLGSHSELFSGGEKPALHNWQGKFNSW